MRAYQFTTEDEDYRMAHRAPMHDSGSPLHDVTGTYPDDIYGPKAIQYYGTREPWDSRSIRVIQLSRNKPNQTIQIFRAVPKEVKSNTINPGDWVTASKEYAIQHGKGLGKYKVLTKIVPAKTLFTNGDSIHEWGYDPGGAAQPVAEDTFNQNFNQINSIITKKYPKEIMNLLLGMFPTAKEAIVNQYKDEDGMPFAEWRRVIWNIDNYVLSGPVVVDGSKLPIDPETEAERLAKYQQYIKDKDSGKPARYFRNNDSDPRTIDFTKLPPITLAQTDAGMDVTDGNHQAFLAKMANKPLRAYVFKRQPNNHPNVAKIKALFSNQQPVAEDTADEIYK